MERHQLRLPGDPTGIEEAHDILAAEDFAMPSGPDRIVEKLRRHGSARLPLLAFVAAAIAALVLAARRRR